MTGSIAHRGEGPRSDPGLARAGRDSSRRTRQPPRKTTEMRWSPTTLASAIEQFSNVGRASHSGHDALLGRPPGSGSTLNRTAGARRACCAHGEPDTDPRVRSVTETSMMFMPDAADEERYRRHGRQNHGFQQTMQPPRRVLGGAINVRRPIANVMPRARARQSGFPAAGIASPEAATS